MNESSNGASGGRKPAAKRRTRNTFVTKSGQTIKVHRNISERIAASRDARARRKAARLAGLPKSRVKRFFYRLHPKRVFRYWFSREGLIMALKITGIGIVAGFLLLVGVFAYFRKDLPNLKDISGKNIGGSIRYYDRTGQVLLWEDYDAVKRIPVADADISQYVKDATVAIEDKDFFNHGGFDMRGIARAAVKDITNSGGVKQGGSTITQQLVKLNNNWTNNKTYVRKIKELILAVELERSYSKQEILTGYLNSAPYGNVQNGVEAATRDYFNKSAKELTLDEAAFLAAVPQSPSSYSPYGIFFKQDPEYWKDKLVGRQHYILGLMKEQGKINQQQYDEAVKIDTLAKVQTPKPKYAGIKAPYFVLTAKEELETRYGSDSIKRGGWKVITTLDMNLQTMAEEQVSKGITQIRKQGGDTAAFAAEDVKTGQVVALVGGPDFFASNDWHENNYARIKIPPGSSFKPYDYTALIENTTNFGAGSVLYDTAGPIPGYPCTKGIKRNGDCAIDYDLRFPGPLTLRYALGGSRNIPAMKAMLIAGVDKTIQTAKSLMQSPGTKAGEARGDYKCYSDEASTIETPCYTASAIGDGAYLRLDEHVHGYGTLSRNGLNIPQTYLLKIEDSAGKVVDEWKPSKGVQAVRAETAYIINDILSDPKASYLSKKSHTYKGWKFGYKTGTTNDSKDGLMMGMSTQYAAGVWVGYHNRTKEMTGFMENMTQPILTGWMNKAHDSLKPEERQRPATIKVLPAFVVRNHVGVGSVEPSPATDLYPSWYQPPSKTTASARTIDIVSNKIATDCTPTRARKEITDTNANVFSGDKFVSGGAATSNSTETDDIHKCDDARPSIHIQSATSSSISVQIGRGTHSLSSDQYPGTVSIVIDGQTVQSFQVNDGTAQPMTLNYSFSGTGAKQVSVVVVDSVLYDASDTTDVTFGDSGSSSSSPLTLSAKKTGAKIKFSWTGSYTGKVTIYKGGTSVCSGTDSCEISDGPAASYYAKDESGKQSDPVTI